MNFGRHVPQAGGVVFAPREKPSTVVAHRHITYVTVVASQDVVEIRLLATQVPHPHPRPVGRHYPISSCHQPASDCQD